MLYLDGFHKEPKVHDFERLSHDLPRLAGSWRLLLIQNFGSLRCLAFSSSSLLFAVSAWAK